MANKRSSASMSTQQPKRLRTLEKRVTKLTRNVNNRPICYRAAYSAAVANGAIYAQPLFAPSSNNDARILYVEVMGSLGGQGVDAYIISGKAITAPVYADFQPNIGGELTSVDVADKYHIWKHVLNTQGSNYFKTRQRFARGYNISIDSTGNPADKVLYFVVKNNSGGAVTVNFSLKSFYVKILDV